MTEKELMRAAMLVASRDAILEFLMARDPESPFIKDQMESEYAHVQRDAAKILTAAMADFSINDASNFDEENPDSLANWFISRDVLERALQHELERISVDLGALGVTLA